MGLDHKPPTALRVTIGRLFFKKVPSLKLSITFPTSIPEEKASIMSWNDQVSGQRVWKIVMKIRIYQRKNGLKLEQLKKEVVTD